MVRSDPSSSQALVTGGAGFIGSNVVWALVAEGRHVPCSTTCSRGTSPTSMRVPGRTFKRAMCVTSTQSAE